MEHGKHGMLACFRLTTKIEIVTLVSLSITTCEFEYHHSFLWSCSFASYSVEKEDSAQSHLLTIVDLRVGRGIRVSGSYLW